MEYTSAIGIAAAAEYVAHTRVLAEAEGGRRAELLGILVSGYDEADARVARLLKRTGYLEQRLGFCVALAQSADPLEMENPARTQRIVQAMTDVVAAIVDARAGGADRSVRRPALDILHLARPLLLAADCGQA